MSKKVVIYSTRYCPYCVRAKMLLNQKGVEFVEFNIDTQPELRQEMMNRSGRHTVPQIFIDEFHVGGCDDLFALEAQGVLDEHLGLIS